MNIVFWGETHRSGTTANYTAMAGILPHLCPDRKIVCGSLQRERCEDSALFLWDAGVCSPAGQKKLLLTADLVVNFEPQDYDGMEQFFLRHMYLEKRMVYLYANCIGTPEPDVLNRVYRVDEGQIGIVRYNAAYDCALKRGLGSSFIAEEYGSARSSRNQEFIDGLVKAADRILKEEIIMEQVMKHYGNAILAIIVLLALGAIIIAALSSDGYVATEFKNALTGFFSRMNGLTP